jgi:diguanylate cyclase (GGDEF)-like protein
MTLRLAAYRTELDTVSAETAWKLVDTLFRQTTSLVIGAAVFIALGAIGFVGTGSRWYLAGLLLAVFTFALRLWQARAYARSRDSATPEVWLRRSIVGAWLTAAGWGAWSTVILFEPEKALVIMVVGAQSACMIGAAVRNCAVKVVAAGQAFMTLVPLFICCVLSGSIYLNIYAAFVAIHILAALALTSFLNRQTLQLLLRDEEKSELVARLESAKQELELINHHLETLAATDALTGVANRRAFDLESAREWRRCAREHAAMSMLLLDVDHFKAFNDFYGHQAGDICLREVAATTLSALRRSADMLARYGGEEFVVILPRTTLEGAMVIGAAVLAAMAARSLVHDASPFGIVTVSIGAACLDPNPDEPVERLIALADAALYAAKRGGRNQVRATSVGAAGSVRPDLNLAGA